MAIKFAQLGARVIILDIDDVNLISFLFLIIILSFHFLFIGKW